MWQVTAIGELGGEYVYRVDAPEYESPEAVACSAYAQHGILYFDFEEVPELLGPIWRAEWNDEPLEVELVRESE